jgi:hypothetical protein
MARQAGGSRRGKSSSEPATDMIRSVFGTLFGKQ